MPDPVQRREDACWKDTIPGIGKIIQCYALQSKCTCSVVIFFLKRKYLKLRKKSFLLKQKPNERLILFLYNFSPTSSLNNKKIASQDDLGSDMIVGVVPDNTPLSSLPGTTVSRASGITATAVTTMSNGPGVRDDSSIASGSSGFGSLPKKKPNDGLQIDAASFISSIVTDSGVSESSEPSNTLMSESITSSSNYLTLQQMNGNAVQSQPSAQNTSSSVEQGHSRNSSNTSQVSEPVD